MAMLKMTATVEAQRFVLNLGRKYKTPKFLYINQHFAEQELGSFVFHKLLEYRQAKLIQMIK